VPLLELDITNLIYDAPRPCAGCGRLADMMCPECYLTKEVLLSEVTFCPNCFDRAHPNRKSDHAGRSVCSRATWQALSNGTKRPTVKRKMLQLTAVLCIETSHYVSFVRIAGTNRWLFFDSMADRVGLEDGYNIPQVKSCDQVGAWLSPAGCHKLRTSLSKDRNLPIEVDNDALVKRLLSDAYICFYSSEPLPFPPSGPPSSSSGTNEKHRRDGESMGMGNGAGHLEVGKAKFFV